MNKTLNKHQGISIGDLVETNNKRIRGYVASIIDYGTHVAFFIDNGSTLKFPAKREWITKIDNNDD